MNPNFHICIAEQGKILQTEGQYAEALRYYKEALKMSQHLSGSDVFFQHYSQCIMECLELSQAYEEVIAYCDKYIQFVEDLDKATAYSNNLRVALYERKAIQYLFLGNTDAAHDIITTLTEVQSQPKAYPISTELHNWIKRGFTIEPRQIKALQKKHNYFIVRKDKINSAIAMKLPKEILTH